MKKLFLIGAMAALGLSCSSDDDGGSNVSVEGTWKLTKFETTEGIDFNNDGTASKNLIAETGCFGSSNIVFGDSDVVIFSMQSIDADTATNEDGGYDYTTTCDPASPTTGTYSVSDNSVTLNAGTSPIALTRSGNKLTYSIPESFNVPVEQNGEIVEVQMGAYIEFTKQ